MFVRCSCGSIAAHAAAGGLRSTTHPTAAVIRTILQQHNHLRLQLSQQYTPITAAPSLSLVLSHHPSTTTRRFSTARASFVNAAETAATRSSLLADVSILSISNASRETVTLHQQRRQRLSTSAGAPTAIKKKKKKGKQTKADQNTRSTAGESLLGATGLKVKVKLKSGAITKTSVKQKQNSTSFYYTTTTVLTPKAVLALKTKPAPKMSQHTQPAPSPYSPYAVLTNFRRLPYKSKAITRTHQLALAPYFDLDPFFTQSGHHRWDIYYDTDSHGKPVLLITLKQAWSFLDYVKRETGIDVPRHPKSNYCYRKKELKPGETPKEPVKVATVGTRTEWEDVTVQWASGTTGRGGEGAMTAEEKEARKQRHKEKQERKKTGYSLQVERAKKLLGFSTPEGNVGTTVTSVIQKESEVTEGEPEGVKITTETLQTLTAITTDDTAASSEIKARNNPEDIPFFVCVDCESWERNHDAITEIGISTLDMGALPPSQTRPTYEAIKQLINYRHIRVREHRQLRNGQFVPDAADLFDFGKTEFWGLSGLPEVLSEAFTPPPLSQQASATGRRTIAFVGHDAATDIKYLTQCKFDARTFVRETLTKLDDNSPGGTSSGGGREMEVFDTADMYKSITGEVNTKGLGKMLIELGLDPWNLHNAGNDAAYTLMGFVKMCEEKPTGGQDQQKDETGAEDGGVKI